MKIKKAEAVALMVALGFAKAGEWDTAKLTSRLIQVPDKVKREVVPEEFVPLYDSMVDEDGTAFPIEVVEGAAGVDVSTLDKKALFGLIEDRGWKLKVTKKSTLVELQKAVKVELDKEKEDPKPTPKRSLTAKARDSKPALAPASDPAAKPGAKPASSAKPRDAFGCAIGSISQKVNAILSDEWQDEKDIAEAAGLTLDQARGRLYYAAVKKVVEYRKRIEYRLVPAKA